MDGRQWIDAIKITGNNGLDSPWVSPAIYLPLRAIFTLPGVQIHDDFSWLAPTPANLAQMNGPVPGGLPPPS